MSVYVRVRVASESYAIPVSYVVEVGDIGEVVPVPGSRPEVLGVRNLRGLVLPVADLAALLGVPRTQPPNRMLVAESGDQRMGLAIDVVVNVEEMDEPTERADSPLLTGAMLVDGHLIGVIDMPRVFEALEGNAHE